MSHHKTVVNTVKVEGEILIDVNNSQGTTVLLNLVSGPLPCSNFLWPYKNFTLFENCIDHQFIGQMVIFQFNDAILPCPWS